MILSLISVVVFGLLAMRYKTNEALENLQRQQECENWQREQEYSRRRYEDLKRECNKNGANNRLI